MEVVVFGDDLTGCNATGMLFRRLGWRVHMVLRFDKPLPVEVKKTMLLYGVRLVCPSQAARY